MTTKTQNILLFMLVLFGTFVVGAGFGTFMVNRDTQKIRDAAYEAGVLEGINLATERISISYTKEAK